MKAVSELTKKYGIKTIVSMNPIMIDGTGMCGGCRVTVGGEIKFACVDGPDFDGHLVDFDEAMRRQQMYKGNEEKSLEEHECRLEVITMPNMSLNKTPISVRDPKVRNKDFQEVVLGYSEEEAKEEAERCLQCKHKPCVAGCPVSVKIPDFRTNNPGRSLKQPTKIRETIHFRR